MLSGEQCQIGPKCCYATWAGSPNEVFSLSLWSSSL